MTIKRTLQPQLGSVLCMLPVRWNVLLKEVKIVSMVEVVDVDGALFQSCSWNGWLDHGRRGKTRIGRIRSAARRGSIARSLARAARRGA
jgi:hypothetical protein